MKLSPSNQKLLTDFGETLERITGENFISFILYGSAVRGNYVPEKSDVNVLIAVRTSTFDIHKTIAEPFQNLRSKLNVTPMLLGMDVAQRTYECFALKFLSIKRNHVVLRGADIFKDFQVDKQKLDFLAEQELRNLRLRMVYGYLLSSKNDERLQQQLFRNYSKSVVILSDILRIENVEVPTSFAERYSAFETFFDVPVGCLRDIQALKEGASGAAHAQLESSWGELFGLLDRVLHIVESKGMLS